jgi:hypothetical protein
MQLISAIGSTYYFNDFKALTYFKFSKNWIRGGVKVLLRDGKLFCFFGHPSERTPTILRRHADLSRREIHAR